MAVQAKSRLTFHQLVDGTTVSFTLSTSQGSTQVKSKDPISFLPDYTKTAQVITPHLGIPGLSGNQVKGACTWYVNGSRVTSGQNGMTIGTTAPYALTIAQNRNTPTTRITCEYTHTDPSTGLNTQLQAEVTLSQVENAGTMILGMILPLDGNIFTTEGGAAKQLRFEGRMIRGGAEDTTNVDYAWHIQGTNGQFYPITAATAPAGSGLPSGNLFANWSSKTLTVSSDAILNIGTLKLVVKDTDSSSSTFNKTAEAIQSVLDTTDPYDLLPDAKQGTHLSRGNAQGLPVELIVRQGYKPMAESFYAGKTLGFYRLTPADAKDNTWSPAGADFAGWQVGAGEVKRTFSSSGGQTATAANRTVRIKNEHLLTAGGNGTTFEFFLDF